MGMKKAMTTYSVVSNPPGGSIDVTAQQVLSENRDIQSVTFTFGPSLLVDGNERQFAVATFTRDEA